MLDTGGQDMCNEGESMNCRGISTLHREVKFKRARIFSEEDQWLLREREISSHMGILNESSVECVRRWDVGRDKLIA